MKEFSRPDEWITDNPIISTRKGDMDRQMTSRSLMPS